MINQALASSTNLSEELFYAIAFSMLKGVPEAQKLKMLRYFQSAENIFKKQPRKQIEWPLKEAEDELKFIDKHSIQCFSILDK